MNPIFQIIFSTVFSLTRTCPKCGREQVVPASKKREAVRCRHCGAEIPPPKPP